ncbi:AAA family ATPase [Aeribacillus pallidus]|uniref:AAA family ATPase n=1 Tax=Aeribacillus pallidus TaxID=33936 RepID=UPI003D227F68
MGSGKTTLARTLSSHLNIPFYELDNVVWKRFQSGDVRRSEKERDEYLQNIVRSNAWIIEGVHYEWVLPSFQQAELIIYLDTPYSIRTYQIIKRFVRQKFALEQANYQPTFNIFWKMFQWNSFFERPK